MLLRRSHVLLVALMLALALLIVPTAFAQDNSTDTIVTEIERVSWGAVIAGSVIALMVQLALNLLGISLGAMSINPEFGEDSTSPKTLGAGAAVWVGISTLIALFFGGWVAGRFAGAPDEVDGLLHGLTVWGLVSLVSLFLLTTSVGRIMSGVSTLIGQGLSLAGSVAEVGVRGAAALTSTAVQGAATVASGAAGVAANQAGAAAKRAGYMAEDAGQAASTGAENLYDAAQRFIENTPEVQDALERLELAFDSAQNELMRVTQQTLNEANIDPNRVQGEARAAASDARATARYAVTHPDDAQRAINLSLRRILRRGQGVVAEVDRQAAMQEIMDYTGMTPEQAQQYITQAEDNYMRAKEEVQAARDQAQAQFERTRQEAMRRAEELQREARQRAEQIEHEAERRAREVAGATTDAIARIAAAVFAALVIGAFAAGAGGVLGSPEEIESAEIDDDTNNEVNDDADVIEEDAETGTEG